MHWNHQAACHALGDYLFFAPSGETAAQRRRREHAAKEICASCPVRAQCADHAHALGDVHGIWGGLTESERRTLVPSTGRPRSQPSRSPHRSSYELREAPDRI